MPPEADPAPYADLGRLITAARERKAWTRQDLARKVGYDGPNGGITVSKIERGLMCPSDARLKRLQDVLEISESKIQPLIRGAKRNPLAAAHARQDNQRRVERLTKRTDVLQIEVQRYYEPVEKARERIEQNFLGPFLEYCASLINADDELAAALTPLQTPVPETEKPGDIAKDVRRLRGEIAGSMGAIFASSAVGGAAGGAAVGAGAAFATYSAVAAMATSSTGTAISSLAGVAASNATLAALGGGSLAAGGLGMAGGTAVLGTIVAAPAILAAGIALFWTSKKWAARAQDESERIRFAELMFDETERRLRSSFEWTTQALGFLSFAGTVATKFMRDLSTGNLADLPHDWKQLKEGDREIIRRLLQLAAVTLTVLPLPALATPDDDLEDGVVAKVERQASEWNDAVLAEAMAWFTTLSGGRSAHTGSTAERQVVS